MRKYLSLIVAAAMAVAVSAAPLTPVVVKASDAVSAQEQPVVKHSLMGRSKKDVAQRAAMLPMKKSIEKTKIARSAVSADERVQYAATQRIARATKADTVRIAANRIAQKEYYEETGDWFVVFYNEDLNVAVILDYISKSFTGSFTTADFDMQYTYIADYTTGKKVEIGLDSLVATITETADFTDIKVIGRSEEGVIYDIHMHHDVIHPKDTVNLVFTQEQVRLDTESDNWFQFEGKNGKKSVSLMIAYNNGAIAGEYTMYDFYPASGFFSGFSYTDEENNILVDYIDEAKATITLTDRVYHINASMIGNDSLFYNVEMTYALPVPTDTIDVAINNLDYVDLTGFLGAFWLEGNNADYAVSLTIAAEAIASGTYEVETTKLINTSKTPADTIGVTEATADVTVDADGNVTAQAEAFGSNNILYRISMAFVVPEPTDTVSISFDHAAELVHYASYGEYGMENRDDKHIAAAYVYADKPEGTFEGNYFDRYYSGVGFINGTDTTIVHALAGKVTLTQKADTTLMYAEMIGEDSTLYKVSMFYALPKAKDTVSIVVPAAETTNLLSNGLYQVHGYTADSVYYISVTPQSSQVAGTFEVSDLNAKYSAIKYMDNNKVVKVSFLGGSVTATMTADSIITMQGALLGSDTILYNVKLTGKLVPEDTGMDYDSKEGEVNITYTGDQIKFTDKVTEKGQLYVTLTAGTDYTSLLFFVEAVDPAITIPAGTYTIDDSYETGTLLANPGVQNGSIYPSFYGQLTSEGIGDPIFFLISGTVKVENKGGKLYFEINAKNSYDRPIHIIYTASSTGMENSAVAAPAVRKVIENGQLFILRGEERFNVLGAKIR